MTPARDLRPVPTSRAERGKSQSARQPVAVERAKRSGFWAGKLDHVDPDRLDDPEEWAKIPILDKEQLRALSTEEFYRDFQICRPEEVCEYWRSGGTTGKPLFYPRTFEDIRYNMVGFSRTYECTGTAAGNRIHNSFPLGIHPAGHMWARSAREMGIGTAWAGAGNALPSPMQLELIVSLQPTVWMGMSSFGLHLANLANGEGIDLANGPVDRLLTTAEPLSDAKREKMEREWGAELFDCFGMTECSMMAAEGPSRDGFHVWTDLAVIEVLNEDTLEPVKPGEAGVLVVTPLWSNTATPFLRWNSGDIVYYREEGADDGPYSVFPIIKHAHRTAGFFKVRGVNINHSEFEDAMFAIREVADFKAEAVTTTSGQDALVVSIELQRGSDPASVSSTVGGMIKSTFEISPSLLILEPKTLANEFAASVKAPRFVDKRG